MVKLSLTEHHLELKKQLKLQTSELDSIDATRLHRALSWMKAAGEQIDADNDDLAFINLWISFSACFYIEGQSIGPFIYKLVELDQHNKIYDCLWHEYSGPVKALIKNPYVFEGFWQAQRLLTESHEQDVAIETQWRGDFEQSSVEALNYLSRKKVPELLSIVLDRLYVLRNQVLQGGATYQSRVNREQVCDGVALLASLMPTVIEIMLNARAEDWGELAYPVINN
jgi:hypothetical protein